MQPLPPFDFVAYARAGRGRGSTGQAGRRCPRLRARTGDSTPSCARRGLHQRIHCRPAAVSCSPPRAADSRHDGPSAGAPGSARVHISRTNHEIDPSPPPLPRRQNSNGFCLAQRSTPTNARPARRASSRIARSRSATPASTLATSTSMSRSRNVGRYGVARDHLGPARILLIEVQLGPRAALRLRHPVARRGRHARPVPIRPHQSCLHHAVKVSTSSSENA
jgi:hypothetical protein